jgi:hypothetical protein
MLFVSFQLGCDIFEFSRARSTERRHRPMIDELDVPIVGILVWLHDILHRTRGQSVVHAESKYEMAQ